MLGKKRILIFIGGFIGLILLILGFLFQLKKSEQIAEQQLINQSKGCVIKIEEKIVRGNSLTPLIKSGQIVKILFGYYDCHKVKREDVVAYDYAGNEVPIIKIVKAVPGDEWKLEQADNDLYNIIVNGKLLRNSEKKIYQLPETRTKMLQLYVKDYPVIPENTYLILGNLSSNSSVDSTRFGLIGKNDILGKVELVE